MFKEALKTLKRHSFLLISYLIFYVVVSILGYFFEDNLSLSEHDIIIKEGIVGLIVTLSLVCLYHFLNCEKLNLKKSKKEVLGESLLLFPGSILQTILLLLVTILGIVLLVLPGVYAFLIFYFSPWIYVLYPDYKGNILLLTKKLVSVEIGKLLKIMALVILFILLPEFLFDIFSFKIKGVSRIVFLVLEGVLFIFFNLVVFEYLFKLVSEHRKCFEQGSVQS